MITEIAKALISLAKELFLRDQDAGRRLAQKLADLHRALKDCHRNYLEHSRNQDDEHQLQIYRESVSYLAELLTNLETILDVFAPDLYQKLLGYFHSEAGYSGAGYLRDQIKDEIGSSTDVSYDEILQQLRDFIAEKTDIEDHR